MSVADFVTKLESLPIMFFTKDNELKVSVNDSSVGASNPWVPRVLLSYFAILDEELRINRYPQTKRRELILEVERYWLERYLSLWLDWNRRFETKFEYRVPVFLDNAPSRLLDVLPGNETVWSFHGSYEAKYIAIGVTALFAFCVVSLIVVVIFHYCWRIKARRLEIESYSSEDDADSETLSDSTFIGVKVLEHNRQFANGITTSTNENKSSDHSKTSTNKSMNEIISWTSVKILRDGPKTRTSMQGLMDLGNSRACTNSAMDESNSRTCANSTMGESASNSSFGEEGRIITQCGHSAFIIPEPSQSSREVSLA